MGTFNFSNMQGGQQQETQNIPREFRSAVEQAKTEPAGSFDNNKTGFWDGVKNFFSGADIDTNAGFIDETGTWNSGKGQELQKYNPTEKQFNNSLAGQVWNSNAYKKYFYSREDVLQEAKKISAATRIPENAILANADNLNNARDVYNYQQRAMDPQAVFRAYPELSELAKKSDTDAAIALHNLKNVRQTQGIIEAMKVSYEADELFLERGRLGHSAMLGKSFTEADLKRLEEIEAAQKNSKELPGVFDDPLGAIVGGMVQSGKMMLRNALNGQKMGVYGAGFGALAGALIGGGSTLGAGTGAGAAAGAKIGYSVGSRIGMAQDMYDEIAGNNYLDYKGYKDKSGKQLLTDNQARTYAAVAAALETGIEFSNADRILGAIKGGAGAQSIKKIIASAKDSTELQSMLVAYLRNGAKNIGEVTISESLEEGAQDVSNRIVTNIAAYNNPDGDIPTYSAKDVIIGGLEASWQALPASFGFGVGAHAGSTIGYARRMAAAMQLRSEEEKANLRTASGLSMLKSLAEDIKVNELFKKAPEVYKEVLKNQLKGTSLETINIDTEMVLNQEGGYELLKSVADKVGMSEEQFANIVETKADLKINTADYVEKNLPEDVNTKLQEYITFDDIGECLARNRQYASRMRREMDRILAFEERQREDALNTFLDKNFPDKEQREVAESVIRRFPDKPAEGVKEIRKALQEKIDAPLKEIIEQLKAGAGKGVSIMAVDADGKPTSWEHSDHGRGVRVSNNAAWYRKWYKEHGRAPSEREYRDLAYDIYTGDNYYGLEGWENDSPEEEQWYAENKAAIEATEQAIARLDVMAPRLEKIDPGELTITKGLSEEAFEVYKEMRGQLERAESKEARQAAQMNAILFARMADRMAEWHRQAGQTKYTAKDFARSVGVEFGGKAAGQKLNQASMNTVHIGTETYVQRPTEEVLKSYYELVNQEPYIIVQVIEGDNFDSRKKNAGMIFNTLYKNNNGGHVVVKNKYNEDVAIPRTAFKEMAGHAKKANLFEMVPYIEELLQKSSYLHTRLPDPKREKRMKPNVEEYRMYARKVQINGTEYYAKIIIRKEKSQKLFLHDIDITKIKNEVSGSGNGGADYSSASKPDKLTSVINSIPWWLNEVKTKLILTNKVQQDDNMLEQKAYHEKQSDAKIIYPSDFSPYLNNQSYRCTNSSKAMNGYGYAMFGDNAAWVDGYGENLYSVFHDDLEDIDNLKKKIAETWDKDVEMETIPADLEVLAREKTGEQIAEDFDPTDIVDGAGAWDIPELVSWAFERGVFEDVPGVKTHDGAVVWDDSIIHKGDKDADVWGKDAEKNKVQQDDNVLDQKAWHGSGAVFDRFDLGYLGNGTGNIMHGWGLYFAKNKRIAETYKKEVSKKDGTQASLYEVEVPDNKHLLDEQKTFGEQPKSVQKNFVEAIKNLDDEQMKLFWGKLLDFKFGAFDKGYRVRQEIKSLNNLANTTIEELPDTGAPKFIQNMRRRNLLSRGYTEEQIERLITDADYRKQEQENIRAKAESLQSEAEKAEAEDNAGKEKIIQQAQADPLAELSNYANRQHFTGEKNYQALAYALGNKDYEWRLASEYLNRYGVKGITYDGGEEGRCFVVFDDKAVDIIERYNQSAGGQSYSMDAGQKGLYKIKGQTAFKANGKKVISLFKAADQSTFMHEMAHVYLHDMLELAKLPNAPKQLLDDVKTLSEWASWRPETFDKEYKGTALEREFRKMHEQIADATKYGYLVLDGKEVTLEQMKLQWAQERFARGFENYLREGKAPTESVKTIFRRFKEWLGTIYKAFVQIGGAPSKEVRAVMDRMIASEEEIDIAMSKKGVDSFADAGGMEYLEGNAKQIYMRMVERAKAEAKEKVLKIALKDVKEDYRKQEKEFFAQEEAEYREKLQAEPVFVIQEHINNNPDLSTSAVCETLGMSVEEYAAKLKEYGGSLDAAVKAHMREFRKSIDNSGFDAQYFREKAEALVEESKYRKLASTMELNIFEQLAKAQKKINAQSVKNMTLTNDEKGVMGTVEKLNKQSQKIEKLEAEKKEEAAKHREEKKELREKLEAEKKEGIAKHREEKEQIIANVRGLRDAALKHYQEFVDYVERKLETMPIGDANNYQMWRRKSAEAQHNSERAIATGKWELAVKYKRAQVIYDMFADRAVRNDKKIKKIEEQLTKRRQSIIKNKNISANERYAYNHMLYVFGFVDADAPMPPRYQEENGFMGVLQKSDAPREVDGLFMECPFFTADGFLNLPEWLVSAAMGTTKREQGHKDLSNEQMKMLAQVMNIIYKRGVDDMTLKTIRSVDGKQMSVDDAIAEITAQVRQHVVERTVRDATGAGDMTKREKAERAINDANQYLVKPEVILKKMGGLAVKYIYEPLKIAADKELRMAGDMQKKLQKLYSGYSAEELYAMRNDAKYKFGTSMITKEKVIMLALNWGTEINAKRVMDGFHVSELDVRNVLANLTEQDWNLVNDIWSLYDEHWDEVRDIEARMTGAVLEKQPNRAFTIIGNDQKSYTLEGGYFPIKYDPRDQRTQEQKADAAAMQQASMSNVAMSLGKGFLKDRTNAKVERRLDLRFEIISGSLADVIHLVAFREPIRDVRRIVLRDDFRSLVNNYLGEAEYKHLRQWTTDCWAEEPIAQSRFEVIAAKLRNAQTMGMMSFRVMTAALNIANAPIVAHYMGTVDMLHALKRFYSAPRKYIDFIFQRSVFMAERAETMDANIYDAIKGPHFMDSVPGAGKAGKLLREHAFKLITWTDLMLALPLWQQEYEKAYSDAVENGRSPQQAQDAGVSAGDAAVRWCFGSGRTVDKAAVQRGRSEFMKQLTMYYSYMSTVYNALNYELWGAKMGYKQAMTWADANKNKELLKAVVKAGSALLAWQLLPAIITALFRAGTSGDDDDLEAEKLLKSIASETLSTLVGGIPVLRDAVPYLLAKAFDEKQFAPRIPIQNTIEQTNRVIQSITNDKKTFGDVMRESGKLLSQTTGAPSTLVDALTTSVTYLETGFDADVSEYLRALILDKKLKNKK